jgi:anti-sigma B factor antagonist
MSEEVAGGTARVVAVSGELDASCAPAFKERILAALAGAEPVVLDLSEVTYIDSTSVGALFAARKATGMTRERVSIVCGGEIRRMFEITGLDLVFDLVDTRAEALAHAAAVA